MSLRPVVAASIAALFTATPALADRASIVDAPMGWASQNGGTTGGLGGDEVTVTSMAELQKYAKLRGKRIIWVQGAVGSYGTRGDGNGDRVALSDDKTILGLPGALMKGGFDLNGVKNVVIRNLVIQGPGACDNACGNAGEARQDGVTVIHGSSNIWLDHLDVVDSEDGNVDITQQSDFVTVSWTRFRYTALSYPSGHPGYSHRFSNLIGGSDDARKEGADKLRVTFFKTWWADGVAERMPRVRFGKVHVANSLFTSTDPGQAHNVRAGLRANLLIEGNVFVGQNKPVDLYHGDYAAVTARNNDFKHAKGNTLGDQPAFAPPYTLNLTDTRDLQSELINPITGAGATLTWPVGAISHRQLLHIR